MFKILITLKLLVLMAAYMQVGEVNDDTSLCCDQQLHQSDICLLIGPKSPLSPVGVSHQPLHQ